MKTNWIILLCLGLWACQYDQQTFAQDSSKVTAVKVSTVNPVKFDASQDILEKRFPTPQGYQRTSVDQASFAYYLRQLPLQPHGAKVHYFDGRLKMRSDVHAAVVKMDVGKRDLQQCADAIMRLRAEYLYKTQQYDQLHFNFTNGFNADYRQWRQGKRIKVDGNKVSWYKVSQNQTSYQSFRRYLNMVFAYAGTLSLEKELQRVDITEIQIGDVFIQGGSPGHAIIVVDVVEKIDSEERLFLLAQSYMPAQEIHILNNPQSEQLSPWFSNQIKGRLATPEWIFEIDDLRRFEE
ncbi:MAG: DUF4846 domain-containing protein [Bacteroidota bacterium]